MQLSLRNLGLNSDGISEIPMIFQDASLDQIIGIGAIRNNFRETYQSCAILRKSTCMSIVM